jgi:cyclophilin family peptidyl-prolyl cis-trans isomerase
MSLKLYSVLLLVVIATAYGTHIVVEYFKNNKQTNCYKNKSYKSYNNSYDDSVLAVFFTKLYNLLKYTINTIYEYLYFTITALNKFIYDSVDSIMKIPNKKQCIKNKNKKQAEPFYYWPHDTDNPHYQEKKWNELQGCHKYAAEDNRAPGFIYDPPELRGTPEEIMKMPLPTVPTCDLGYENQPDGSNVIMLPTPFPISYPTEAELASEAKNPYVFMEVKIGNYFQGTLVIELYFKDAPLSAYNFKKLCMSNHDSVKYKNAIFHRIIRDFMIQGGDFEKGNGTGGISIYGKKFQDEIENNKKRHDRLGVLSMANSGPNTNGSQFFILTAPQSHLDGKHTVFGQVVKGLDIIRKMESVQTHKDTPLSPVQIVSCGEAIIE